MRPADSENQLTKSDVSDFKGLLISDINDFKWGIIRFMIGASITQTLVIVGFVYFLLS